MTLYRPFESRQSSGDRPGISTKFGRFGPDIFGCLHEFRVSSADHLQDECDVMFSEQIQESRLQPMLISDLDGVFAFARTLESIQKWFQER
jgi:hypothetical protein